MSFNRYFRVNEPFLVLKPLGTCETQTYVGASMALRTVKEAFNAVPGDEIHALMGGTFLVTKEGGVTEISIVKPKHVYESKYGFRRNGDRLGDFIASGALQSIENPIGVAQYRDPHKSERKFPKLHNEIIWKEHSALFVRMQYAFPDVMSYVKGNPAAQIGIRDIDEEREVQVTARQDKTLFWNFTVDEATERSNIYFGSDFEKKTSIVSSLSDLLDGCEIRAKDEYRVYLNPTAMQRLERIQERLAWALEEYLEPVAAPSI